MGKHVDIHYVFTGGYIVFLIDALILQKQKVLSVCSWTSAKSVNIKEKGNQRNIVALSIMLWGNAGLSVLNADDFIEKY